MTVQLVFSFDVQRCSGCMACVVACLDQNDLPGGEHAFRHVTPYESGNWPRAGLSWLSMACPHCGDAPCITVCPTRALFKREQDGIVALNRDLCVGCHSCMLACPFGAPQFPEGHRMAKCDFCLARIQAGLDPACVQACPTRALGFGPAEALSVKTATCASRTILQSLSVGEGRLLGV
jgi:anaerobic dimethyl sulfoxide reductase subunit B (iron-sulfur subunit)